MNFSIIKIMAIAVPVFAVCVFIFSLVMFLSPKLRGKIMARQIKATKHMMSYSKEDLEDLANMGIDIKKNIIDENETTLKEISKKEADIQKEGIEIKTRAIKDGFTKDKIYCKHCGESIDEDSKFCKKCGKEQ